MVFVSNDGVVMSPRDDPAGENTWTMEMVVADGIPAKTEVQVSRRGLNCQWQIHLQEKGKEIEG